MNLPKSRRAFTLIELLTVIAIIGILAAIIIPTTGAVRKAAKKSKTRVQFTNWIGAMEAFKQEYGYYPKIDITAPASTTRTYLVQSEAFAAALTGRDLNGARITDVNDRYGNKKERSFYSLANSDLNTATPKKLLDTFGNEQIVVLFDINGDGLIKVTGADKDGDLIAVKAGDPASGTGYTPTSTAAADSDIPTSGLRASVIFYSAGQGDSAKDLVMSWK